MFAAPPYFAFVAAQAADGVRKVDHPLQYEEGHADDHDELGRPDRQIDDPFDGTVGLERRPRIGRDRIEQQADRPDGQGLADHRHQRAAFAAVDGWHDLQADMLAVLLATREAEIDDDHHHEDRQLGHQLQGHVDRPADDIDDQQQHHRHHQPSGEARQDSVDAMHQIFHGASSDSGPRHGPVRMAAGASMSNTERNPFRRSYFMIRAFTFSITWAGGLQAGLFGFGDPFGLHAHRACRRFPTCPDRQPTFR